MDDRKERSTSNHPERAIALEYADAGQLPKVLLSGTGQLAREILALAEKHRIPIRKDEGLAEILSVVRSGHSISRASFQLVAEVLSFLYVTDLEWRSQHAFMDTLVPPE